MGTPKPRTGNDHVGNSPVAQVDFVCEGVSFHVRSFPSKKMGSMQVCHRLGSFQRVSSAPVSGASGVDGCIPSITSFLPLSRSVMPVVLQGLQRSPAPTKSAPQLQQRFIFRTLVS